MAIYRSQFFHIDIEEQDYPDADCKFMISLWHTPKGLESRELIAIGLSDNMPMLQSTRNKGNVVESVTAPHAVPIPYGNDVNIHSRLKGDLYEANADLERAYDEINKLQKQLHGKNN